MQKYEWISKQTLETLITPFPHANKDELLEALESKMLEIFGASSAADLLVSKTRRDNRIGNSNYDKDDVYFQVYYKFSAWGYDSPEEMLEAEPELAEILESDDDYDDNRVEVRENDKSTVLNYARSIIDLQHQILQEEDAKFVTGNLDPLSRKIVHNLVEASNKTCHPLLPKLKTATICRKNNNAKVEITRLAPELNSDIARIVSELNAKSNAQSNALN